MRGLSLGEEWRQRKAREEALAEADWERKQRERKQMPAADKIRELIRPMRSLQELARKRASHVGTSPNRRQADANLADELEAAIAAAEEGRLLLDQGLGRHVEYMTIVGGVASEAQAAGLLDTE